MDETYLVLVVLLFPLLFAGLWLAVTTLLGVLSGWRHLQERFADRTDAALFRLRWQSGALGKGSLWNPFGNVSYGSSLHLEVCRRGLRVRLGRFLGPFLCPFLVPWDQIRGHRINGLFGRAYRLELGDSGYSLTLRGRTAERIAEASQGQLQLPTG